MISSNKSIGSEGSIIIGDSMRLAGSHEDTLASEGRWENYTGPIAEYLQQENCSTVRRDPLYIVLPITVIYAVIFLTGLIGNVSTCVVIARNKSMHTATNYYLFSLAVSDLLLLISGLPPEMYYIWSHFPYVFGEAFCIIQSFAAETSANATVLTITAFTVERYVAICHPFISHTMSKLSRAVKFVIVIWLLALCLAVPQAVQFGIVYDYRNGSVVLDSAQCSIKWYLTKHAFEISTMLFFVLPMTIITVLYVLIAIKLRQSRLLSATAKRNHLSAGSIHGDSGRGKSVAQKNVIRMLVAVVVAFFVCWAPFHAQRLLAVHAKNTTEPKDALVIVYTILTYMSGVFYYLSTTVNPLLYNIMSNKFRDAFKSMLPNHCGRKWSSRKSVPRQPTCSSLSRYARSTFRQTDDRQNSPSISVSDDNQKLRTTNTINGRKDNRRNQSNCVANKINHREYSRSVSRGSNSSQFTLMSSVSKSFNEGNNNVTATYVNIQRAPRVVTLGILAGRLRLGTKELFSPQQKTVTSSAPKPETRTVLAPRFQSHPSIESANTISNSSLKDYDETEFTGMELARYMGELNCDLIT
ncbi:pyrokinin-1 receptor-like [Bombus pyrosoma]|uniref:pyrokinin-1 receptor-like n=1 Tax=Bombus pyrosoma TaxID=396416 RepID=UPI001CB9C204|nr:pyrokinin-1 receptor-like [Bombus pyrosoma]XP_043580468.1 pyrokinin-1 receptor-like [Bombus pyrosoma]XP_043580469.1 pyrokinin-1 receptor-like [Bombus pyrosoma]XP_043580470.1 pyrokinin-1 receptor-like [Bombus pyrosoma]XP_043580471.1 pyrokinin-1 receptor-like [Bombus pyrosoma]XP_043580472.1 pyrokinin-1 receptor-like [Bombus pyrosoma]XP_043580473.1 pyrokinin-1 receptor-like [Bombus pyrosoma]XP_043580475.1 pyrokinin-1 receptor-like [Bombus pyrosoma]XP_043580476.1 pyrokinin-1 receptor-like [B